MRTHVMILQRIEKNGNLRSDFTKDWKQERLCSDFVRDWKKGNLRSAFTKDWKNVNLRSAFTKDWKMRIFVEISQTIDKNGD